MNETLDQDGPPAIVMWIVAYEIVKAVLLFVLFFGLTHLQATQNITDASANPVLNKNPFLIFVPLVAISLIIIGGGLWFLQNWARHALIPWAGLNFIYWTNIPLVDGFDTHLLRSIVPAPVTCVVVALDLLVILALNLPEVKQKFLGPLDDPDLDEVKESPLDLL